MSVLIRIHEDGTISFNNEKFLQNPAFYVSDDKKFRSQATLLLKDKDPLPLDIVIYGFNLSRSSLVEMMCGNGSIIINFNGEELKSKTKFDMNIVYRVSSKKSPWAFSGNCGDTPVNRTFENPLEIFNYFYKLFNL